MQTFRPPSAWESGRYIDPSDLREELLVWMLEIVPRPAIACIYNDPSAECIERDLLHWIRELCVIVWSFA